MIFGRFEYQYRVFSDFLPAAKRSLLVSSLFPFKIAHKPIGPNKTSKSQTQNKKF